MSRVEDKWCTWASTLCLLYPSAIHYDRKLSDAHPVVGVPVGNPYSKDVGSSRLEHTTYELLQRASTNSGIYTDAVSSKMNDMFSNRNLWELISSSTDVIPLRTNFNNGSSHLAQWKSTTKLNSQLSVESRLQKLEHHFNSLRVYDDDCRQRLLCEIAESPAKFSPLTSAFLDETSFNGDEKTLASKLLETNDGTRLLTYIEATQRGNSRQGCGIWTYRCPIAASSMIDFKALLVWREVSKWLTVKFIAKKHPN
ncbi:UDP-N-acetylglucosamine--N-acetylmuramyl-(pentapeptide) pyrophosphoryl-undecaprenol N-acetylglucosamine transferase [Orchesella cincta]|uniref:UDP-N-acetylglucosamine--N-acetylmuramyl-(Pentapeptide) pyrophosphoryl-undecaprenol N-acetylglucosamine transferase n=1 Tax=Orchesella cincta TaxID=48709 RepID=A0A1D2N3V9_ORCCI|nr:UDP-N-acetylglucosamine--N-acetylmuramyl-(pentapeptide) pyrophosphoryl-undecaprenol N-acetylglucosamine transferase [Orchesella cincta]